MFYTIIWMLVIVIGFVFGPIFSNITPYGGKMETAQFYGSAFLASVGVVGLIISIATTVAGH